MEKELASTHIPVTPSGPVGIVAWCLFDWANSAFITLIAGFVFGPYLTDDVAPNKILGTELWSWMIAIVGVVVAIIAPLLGATIDQLNRRKPWMLVFMLVTVIATALLWFTQPSVHWLAWGMIFFVLAAIAFEFNQVIYNTVLYCIAPRNKVGRLSGWGWGSGYFGGLVAMSIALLVFIKSGWFTHHGDIDIRLIVLFVAVWVLIFSLPFFFFTPDQKKTQLSLWCAFIEGMKTLSATFHHVRKNRQIFVFLIAHLFFMDGLNTLLAYSAIYCAGVFHMSMSDIVIFAILINVLAGIGAIVFAWVDDWLGPKLIICLSLIILSICVLVMLLTYNIVIFWIFGLIAGVFIGPVQSSSRSYMARIVPPHLATQLFGFYALSGRVTSFIGPLIVAGLVALFNSQRVSLMGPLVLMIIGFLIVLKLPRVIHRKARS